MSKNPGSTSRRLAVAAVVAIAIGVPLVAFAATRGHYTPTGPVGGPVQFAPSRGHVAPLGPDLEAGLVDLSLGLPLVQNPRLGRIDVDDIHGPLLEFDLLVPSFDGGDAAEGMWQGDVFAGAAAARLAASGVKLTEVRATLVAPNGARQPIGGGLGDVVPDQVFSSAPADISSKVDDKAGDFGLNRVDTKIVHGLRDAIVIHGVASDVTKTAVAIADDPRVLDEFVGERATHFEAVFLQVDDTSGNPAYVKAIAANNGSSLVWARPDLGITFMGSGVGK